MNFVQKTLILFFTSIFLHCHNHNEKVRQKQVLKVSDVNPMFNPAYKNQGSIDGKWYYSFFMYSSCLTLYENGVFKFYDRGCLGVNYTEGNWIKDGNSVLLNSFEKYREPKRIKTLAIKSGQLKRRPTTLNENKKAEITIGDFSFDDTILVTFRDTANIFFTNLLLRQEGDSLYEIDKNSHSSRKTYSRKPKDLLLPFVPVLQLYDKK